MQPVSYRDGCPGGSGKKLRESPGQRLWHDLALAIGGRTVAELKRDMSSKEFVDWAAYNNISPFTPDRVDLGFAVVAKMLYDIHKKKGARGLTYIDFMPLCERLAQKAGDQKLLFMKALSQTNPLEEDEDSGA